MQKVNFKVPFIGTGILSPEKASITHILSLGVLRELPKVAVATKREMSSVGLNFYFLDGATCPHCSGSKGFIYRDPERIWMWFCGKEECLYFDCEESKRLARLEWMKKMGGVTTDEFREPLRSQIPKRYHQASFEKLERNPSTSVVIEALEAWIKNPKGFFLMSGTSGVGKTHLSVCALRAAPPVWTVYFNSVTQMFKMLQAIESFASKQAVIERWCNADLLVIDDLGAEGATTYKLDCLFDLIDSRWSNDRATIVTTNLNAEEVSKLYGQRMVSRLISGKLFKMTGKDKRSF